MSFLARFSVRAVRPTTLIANRYYTSAVTESLVARLKDDRKTFMKAKKQPDLNVVKGLLSDFTYYIKSPNFVEGTSDDEALMSVLQKAIKRRQDSISQYESGGRPELAEKESEELKVLQNYLPEQMTAEAVEAEVQKLINELGVSSKKDMGKVMKAWTLDAAVADRKLVSDIVKKLLN